MQRECGRRARAEQRTERHAAAGDRGHVGDLLQGPEVDAQLHRPILTLLPRQEYRHKHPEGLGYSHFCDHYSPFRQKRLLVMRQARLGSDKLFVVCSDKGGTATWTPTPASVSTASVSWRRWAHPNLTYAEATAT